MLSILARAIPADPPKKKKTAIKTTPLRKSPQFAVPEDTLSARDKLKKLDITSPADDSSDENSATSASNTSSSSSSSASSTSSAEVTTTSAPDLFAQYLKFLPGSGPKNQVKRWKTTNLEVLLRFSNVTDVDDLPIVWKNLAEARKGQERVVLQEACRATSIRLNLPAPITPAAFCQIVLDLACVYRDPNSLLYGYSC